MLGKIKQLERSGEWDVIVVDGPAAGPRGHVPASAAGLHDAVAAGRCAPRPTRSCELLHDPTRCQVVLVTLPETTPVNELVETAYALEDRVGVQLGPVVVNAVDGLGDAACPTRRRRPRRRPGGRAAGRGGRVPAGPPGAAGGRVERLGSELALEQSHLPLLPVAGMDGRRRRRARRRAAVTAA